MFLLCAGGKDEQGKRRSSFFSRFAYTIAIIVVAVIYPLFLLPYYRASATTDWTRLILVCGMHPVAQELIMLSIRYVTSTMRAR